MQDDIGLYKFLVCYYVMSAVSIGYLMTCQVRVNQQRKREMFHTVKDNKYIWILL